MGDGESAQERPDWSGLMARAQNGDAAAYRRLLGEIAPYLRSLAAKRHRDPLDIEDSVQDILLTIHAVRATYDPARWRSPTGGSSTACAARPVKGRARHFPMSTTKPLRPLKRT